ncbi:hypothetical protein AJ80_08656 [Polytolypa hystricis UAMH7299]|uniref:Enoyl reductase (ER) domain-containing protein n=1 Tax=Polytolypa hystricis (strain UAMH7299) TaxID=1447883 RepID=A0A2B7X3W2_POLH7|nr:hypothetical protein AJ80_08656 [Polytolypa hystricis UAMH7299]
MTTPSSTASWILTSQNVAASLQYVEQSDLPRVGEHDVLLKIHAASLNYRDLALSKGQHSLSMRPNVVPGSDGAGVVEAVGSQVSTFKRGDRVCTHMTSQMPVDAPATFADINAGLGQQLDGTLREYGVFHESSLVKMPSNLDFLEAATLTCSALTAWNALFGLEGKIVRKGDVVLVQGTGGVSIAALQFALAAGAMVIATTSSEEKATKLKSLGATHVINYKIMPSWGEVAKGLTPNGQGVHIVVDVGGLSTLDQSVKAVRTEGLIVVTGLLGGDQTTPTPILLDCLTNLCTARGVLLGSRRQFEAMNRFIEDKQIKPVLDERSFDLASAKEAYAYMIAQRHFSKIAIKVC